MHKLGTILAPKRAGIVVISRSTLPSDASSFQRANRAIRPTRGRTWAKRVLVATVLVLPPALLVSHFWPFGIAHYYAMDWALTRDRSEIALINGTLAVKHSRIRGIPQDARVRGHLSFVDGYRQTGPTERSS